MKKLYIALILLTFQVVSPAQERNHMPYSMFGVGKINPRGFARNLAMGRTGIALSSPFYLNNVNPAACHTIDSISFFFDFGISGDFVSYKTSYEDLQRGHDVNLNQVAMGFRVMKNWSSSIGIAPYSEVGYKVKTMQPIVGTIYEEYEITSSGNGGLTHFYWDNSYLLFKRLSLGVNFTYLFGHIEHSEKMIDSRTGIQVNADRTSYLNKIYADFGLQYFTPIGKNYFLTLGGIFGNQHRLNFKHETTINDSEGTISYDRVDSRGTFDFPMYAGGGFALTYKKRLTFTTDYVYHNWSDTESDDLNIKYINSHGIRTGLEYIPGNYSKWGYFAGVSLRAGFYYETSYLEIAGQDYTDKGLTLGVGLPFLQNKTSINLSYNLGKNGTLDKGLIQETSHSFLVSLTLHDWWFIKRKID